VVSRRDEHKQEEGIEMQEKTVTLALKEYMPPDCTCAIEDKVRGSEGVVAVSVNPVDDVVQVTYDPEKIEPDQIKAVLERCGYRCEGEVDMPSHAHMEHEHEKAEGHDHHAMMEQDFRRRFWVVLALSVPVLLFSPTIQRWFGFTLTFPGARYVLFALATLITF